MLRTALLIDPVFSEHVTEPGHCERSERIECLYEVAEEPRRDAIVRVDPRSASREEILGVHTAAHFERVAQTARADRTHFDADTTAMSRTFEVALLSAGGLLTVIDRVMEHEADNGFALVRPPGHHAESDRVMGFCYFNNVAVGAEYLRRQHNLERIAIFDWDVHHGNGTQEIFEEDPGVFFASIHEHPCYPGTGRVEERGTGAGLGRTLNVPLPAGCGDAEYLAAFEQIVAPALRDFDPQFLLVSAGFDAHVRDPLGAMNVTEEGFTLLTRNLLTIANEHCDGRLVAVLEGGYNLVGLRDSVRAVLQELAGEKLDESSRPTAQRTREGGSV